MSISQQQRAPQRVMATSMHRAQQSLQLPSAFTITASHQISESTYLLNLNGE